MGSPDAATNLTDMAAELLAAHDRAQSQLEEDASIVRTPPATSQSPCASICSTASASLQVVRVLGAADTSDPFVDPLLS